MAPADVRSRIADQFSGRGERAEIWRALELLVDTDAYLNLGYSPWYLPHVVGSSQRRLAGLVGEHLAAHLDATANAPLLDVGCGRGGPTVDLATRFGFRVTGVDLVPANVRRATERARERGADARFVVGDATALPIAPGSMAACTSMDALVYVPDRAGAIAAMADVLAPDGVLVCTDLLCRPGIDEQARGRVAAFADAWDMPPPGTAAGHRQAMVDAGLDIEDVESLTASSVGRFRRWTALFLRLFAGPAGPLVVQGLRRAGLDPTAIWAQVRRTHEALPFLEHRLFVARA